MNKRLTFKKPTNRSIEIVGFDNDNELEIEITPPEDGFSECYYLSPNEVNELISFLSDQLKSVGEPVKLLGEEGYKI